MADDEFYVTTVNLRAEQKVVQQLYPQKFSEMVRNLADAMIKGINLSELPPEIAEEVAYARKKADLQKTYLEGKNQLKADFFLYLDQNKLPLILARTSPKQARKLARDFVTPYRAGTGNILPDCYVGPFLKEYFEIAEYSGKMTKAWSPIQEKIVEDFNENIIAEE